MRIEQKIDRHPASGIADFGPGKSRVNDQHHHQWNSISSSLLRVNHPELFGTVLHNRHRTKYMKIIHFYRHPDEFTFSFR